MPSEIGNPAGYPDRSKRFSKRYKALFVIIHAVANKDNRFRLFLRIVSEIGQLLAVARLEFFHNRPPA